MLRRALYHLNRFKPIPFNTYIRSLVISGLVHPIFQKDQQSFLHTSSKMSANAHVDPPVCKQIPHNHEKFGHVRPDPYFWLRNRKDDPDVEAYLNAENEYIKKIGHPIEETGDKIFQEMKGRIPPADRSAPYKDGDYYYGNRFVEGCEYPVYFRHYKTVDAPEEVILDVNELSKEHPKYFDARRISKSPSHKLLAYAVDTQGRRFYNIHFRDLETGKQIGQVIENVTGNYTWATEDVIFYSKQDPETLRSHQVFRYNRQSQTHELVFEEKDETFSVRVGRSSTRQYIFIQSHSTLSSEASFIPVSDPTTKPRVIQVRESEHEYSVDDMGTGFLLATNWKAKNFRIMATAYDKTAKEHWQEVVAHDPETFIEDVDVFKNYLVVTVKRDALTHMDIYERDESTVTGVGNKHTVKFPEKAYVIATGVNAEYDTSNLRYIYESLTTPSQSWDYSMSDKSRVLVKQKKVLGGFNEANYKSDRIWVPSRDGKEKIPVDLVWHKDHPPSPSTPLLQYGYGSYGITIDPTFGQTRLSLLDRGFVWAIAHIRGGSIMGRRWYEDGRQLRKLNTFYDFIDVSKGLTERKMASPEHLYALGGSAGGLLMGGIMNMAPELYCGICAMVPFVDVMTTMLDESIPLTTGEYDEWGNPNKKEFYDYMVKYSPYDNVDPNTHYPHLLVMTGLHDSQVQYWEPAKWVARLREYRRAQKSNGSKVVDRQLLFKTDMDSGHSGSTGRYKPLKDFALIFSFMVNLENGALKVAAGDVGQGREEL